MQYTATISKLNLLKRLPCLETCTNVLWDVDFQHPKISWQERALGGVWLPRNRLFEPPNDRFHWEQMLRLLHHL